MKEIRELIDITLAIVINFVGGLGVALFLGTAVYHMPFSMNVILVIWLIIALLWASDIRDHYNKLEG